MPTLQAQIRTEQASRYLVQFCKHAAAMGRGGHTARMHLHAPLARREVQVTAEWSDTNGTVTFTPWGRCTLSTDDNTLMLRIDAADDDGATQIRDIITRDFERFAHRDPITVTWQRSEPLGAAPFQPTDAVARERRRGFPRPSLQTILLVLAVVLVIALHVGLAGTVVAQSRWTGVAVDVVAALVVVKIGLIAWVRFRIPRRRATTTVSIDEATSLYQQAPDARRLIIGSGQYGNVELSPEAAASVKERKWDVVLLPTPQAIKAWNGAGSSTLGLFHVTC